MRFSIWPNPAGRWESTLAISSHVAESGWDGIWYSDHFMPNTPTPTGPIHESLTTVAALAAAVPRVRLGTLVIGNTYREPSVLAKMSAEIDQISGGRFVLGLGAGWQENEHAAYGIRFPTIGERLRRLEEACQVITGLWENPTTTFEGRYYQLKDAPLEPKPVQSPLPLLIGGGGEKKTLRIVATYANEWNVWGLPAVLRQKGAILDEHCKAVGRPAGEIKRSAVAMLALSDDEEFVKRTMASGRPVIAGNVEQVKATIREYVDAGVDEIILPDWNLGQLDAKKATYDRFIAEVAPEFRGG